MCVVTHPEVLQRQQPFDGCEPVRPQALVEHLASRQEQERHPWQVQQVVACMGTLPVWQRVWSTGLEVRAGPTSRLAIWSRHIRPAGLGGKRVLMAAPGWQTEAGAYKRERPLCTQADVAAFKL